MNADNAARLAPGAFARILASDDVTPPTRRALEARLNWTAPAEPSIGNDLLSALRAVCDRLILQPEPSAYIDIAARLDARLAAGSGDGWRYDALPPDRIAMIQGLAGIDQTAVIVFDAPFTALQSDDQDAVLRAVQAGSPPGEVWTTLNAALVFTELLAQVTEIYYAHPHAQEQIGYVGMADAHGYNAIGLNQRDPVEHRAYRQTDANAAL